jgi:hypothetical protein
VHYTALVDRLLTLPPSHLEQLERSTLLDGFLRFFERPTDPTSATSVAATSVLQRLYTTALANQQTSIANKTAKVCAQIANPHHQHQQQQQQRPLAMYLDPLPSHISSTTTTDAQTSGHFDQVFDELPTLPTTTAPGNNLNFITSILVPSYSTLLADTVATLRNASTPSTPSTPRQ